MGSAEVTIHLVKILLAPSVTAHHLRGSRQVKVDKGQQSS